MFESRNRTILALLAVSAGLISRVWLDSGPMPQPAAARSSKPEPAQRAPDLGFLRRCWTAPRHTNESNHYFDLWSEGALPVLGKVNRLTNNNALLIDSHGKAVGKRAGLESGFVLYPHQSLAPLSEYGSLYTAKDFADVLGVEQAARIHNILIAACNEQGKFRSQEWRRSFVNATNIVYMTPGKLAYKPMFYQAIVLPSSEIKQLYGRTRPGSSGRVDCQTSDAPFPGATPLGCYVADLYLPEAPNPFRTVKAGRELLERNAEVLRADAQR